MPCAPPCHKFAQKGISYGFGGIAALGKGMLPAEHIIREHYRLGSTCAILSRSFCDVSKVEQIEEIRAIFDNGIKEIREFEHQCETEEQDYEENLRVIAEKVQVICSNK